MGKEKPVLNILIRHISECLGRNLRAKVFAAALLISVFSSAMAQQPPDISGEQKQWHCVTLTWKGPEVSETDNESPFLNYRLDVTFEHQESKEKLVVPGFFAADGIAAETSAEKGSQWRVHFSPSKTGAWTYRASMLYGEKIAVADRGEGKAVESVDGSTGKLSIEPSDKASPDWRYRGQLAYVGSRYLRCLGIDRPFLKAGTDSPETLLGYTDFDGTFRDMSTEKEPRPPHGIIPLPSLDQGLHRYKPHEKDWLPSDPTWKQGLGKGIIGGINYLSSRGVNSIYFLTMNVNGDGRNVWPWRAPWERTRFDCSKLDQWEIVFSHMTKRGLQLHIVTQETENDTLLDGGDLEVERRLYYRELVARFAHHPAVCWNLGEENVQSVSQRKECAAFLRSLDPYDHPIVIHNDHWHAKNVHDTFDPLLGDRNFTGTSLQDFYWNDIPSHVAHFVKSSREAGHPWVVSVDEMGGANFGTLPDAKDPEHDLPRKFGLWGSLMAGGAGVEWYFGWDNNSPDSDLSSENWRTREKMFDLSRSATDFFQTHTNLDRLEPRPDLVNGLGVGCLAEVGKQYVIYLPNGGATRVSLPNEAGRYSVRWFNPRSGGELQEAKLTVIRSGDINGKGTSTWAWTGEPPSDHHADWVVLLNRIPESAPKMAFPSDRWATANPEEMGIDPAGLNHALNYWKMHTGDAGIDQVVVVRRGVMIHQGNKADKVHNIYSCTKSFTSTCLGLLIQDGVVGLDTLAAEHEPSLKALYGTAQLKHFATMTSGYSAVGISRWDGKNADWSLTPYQPEPPFFEPGKGYAYWDEAQMMFARVLTRASKRDLFDLLKERVLKPTQIESVKWIQEGEADGVPIRNGCTGISIHAMDLARFGHLMLNRGSWNGKALVDPAWVDQATVSQVEANIPIANTDRKDIVGSGVYGYNWWTNGVNESGKRWMPDAPPKTYFAAGLKHNICLVIPEWEMVLVRMGEDRNPVDGHEYVLNHLMRKLALAVHPLE